MLMRMWSNKNSHSLTAGVQNDTATLEDSLVVPYKTKHILIIRSSNCALWHLPKELKIYVHTKACTQMFLEALLIIVKTWKQPRCPSVGEWIHKLWYIHTMEYYSLLKRNELSSHERYERTLNTCYKVKEVNLKRLHTAWFYVYDILEKAKS